MAKSPRPPAPIAPAMAVMPTRLTKVIIVTRVMPGMLSRRYTEKMISRGEKPIAWLASMRP